LKNNKQILAVPHHGMIYVNRVLPNPHIVLLWFVRRALHFEIVWLFTIEDPDNAPVIDSITPFFQILFSWDEFIGCLLEFRLKLGLPAHGVTFETPNRFLLIPSFWPAILVILPKTDKQFLLHMFVQDVRSCLENSGDWDCLDSAGFPDRNLHGKHTA
jgi:hypothetical protein